VNRLAAARLHDQPDCGKCARALFTAQPVDMKTATFLTYL
jgi:thioredoxin 2